MATLIPEKQIQFANLAAKLKYITPEQVRAAFEIYRRYQSGGGEVPSVQRIIVGKGWLPRGKAEALLRHLLANAPLPAADGPLSPPPGGAVPLDPSEAVAALKAMPAAPKPAHAAPKAFTPPPPPPPPLPKIVEETELEEDDDLGLEPVEEGSSTSGVGLAKESSAVHSGDGGFPKIKGYTITQELGEGSMGKVYRAHQISMDRGVALKVLPTEKCRDQHFVEEFLAEARNAGRLNHPNLIRVHEVNKSGEAYYYSMEFVEGQRLDEWMDECEDGRIDPKQAVNVFIQVAAALDYGFRSNVIHREIRPNNIHVTEDGQAKLADLGLTKDEQTRFLEGENAYYVAPEQAGGEDADTRTDIYSLGCCLFHALTGERPLEGGGPKEVLGRRLSSPPPDPSEINPALSRTLSDVVMRMMQRDPVKRFQTPSDVVDALKKVSFAPSGSGKKILPVKPMMKKPLRPGIKPLGHPPHKVQSARQAALRKRRR